jgi:hypothetical protein
MATETITSGRENPRFAPGLHQFLNALIFPLKFKEITPCYMQSITSFIIGCSAFFPNNNLISSQDETTSP